ncbi:MAG: MFS transporter [Planctomycetota bacterium]|jgi:MFS family permease
MSRSSGPSSGSTSALAPVLLVTFLASLGTGVFWFGLPFIARQAFDFSQLRNLALSAMMGVIYTLGAFRAGSITRRLERRLSPRSVLGWCLALQALACLLPVATSREWGLWIAAAAVTVLSSVAWPIIESYVTSGRHGRDMQRAIGWFNLTWMPAVVVPMFVMAPLLERHGVWAIAGLSGAGVLALLILPGFGDRPAPHDHETAATHVAPEYPLLLRSVRVLLPLSYVLTSAMSPILPYRFEEIGVDVQWQTPSTATWMILRVVALLVMWRLPFWHGRWGTLLLGAATMTAGFAAIILATTLPVMLLGFATLGVGVGVVYYTALYYAMSVGLAEVEAGGTHEGLIGVGYAVGPLAGMAGVALGGSGPTVAVVWALVALGAVPAVHPYLRARQRRAGAVVAEDPDP